jgi:septal ring factor EnvC (AmiA/AmiB activator)
VGVIYNFINNKNQIQLQTIIDDLTETLESLNQKAQGLCEKQKQLQVAIDCQTQPQEATKRTVQEQREKHKQLQATIFVQTTEETKQPDGTGAASKKKKK